MTQNGALKEHLLPLLQQIFAHQIMLFLATMVAGATHPALILTWLNLLGKRLASIEAASFPSFTKGIAKHKYARVFITPLNIYFDIMK